MVMDKTKLRPFSIGYVWLIDYIVAPNTNGDVLSGLIVGTFYLSRNLGSSFAFDKPIHTSVVLLASTAATVIAFAKFWSRGAGQTSKGHEYTAVPLTEVGQPHDSRQPSPSPGSDDVRYPSSLRKLRLCFFVLICAICVRVAITRHILANIQCTVLSWEPFIPLLLAIWDYATVYRHKRSIQNDDPTSSIDDALEAYAAQSPYRFVFAAGVVAVGSLIALSTSSGHSSSYICASSLNNHWLLPIIQRLGTITDLVILYCLSQLLEGHEGRGSRSVSVRFMSVGWALLVCSSQPSL